MIITLICVAGLVCLCWRESDRADAAEREIERLNAADEE